MIQRNNLRDGLLRRNPSLAEEEEAGAVGVGAGALVPAPDTWCEVGLCEGCVLYVRKITSQVATVAVLYTYMRIVRRQGKNCKALFYT